MPQCPISRQPRTARAVPVSAAAVVASAVLALLTAGCSSTSSPTPSTRTGTGRADEIHLGWPGDPRTSVAVDWHTDRATASTVAVQVNGHWRRVSGHRPSPPPVGSGAYHEALVTGLHPGTTYAYAVTGTGGLSAVHQFTTAPADPVPFRFDAFADQGACTYNRAACRVISGITADRPAFVLGAGDLSYANEHGPQVADHWLDDVQAYAAESPLMPTVGNHEFPAGDPTGKYKDPISNYKGRFAVPSTNGKDYYSFNYADTHVVALPEIYVKQNPNGRFLTWLAADLAAARRNPRISWIVAFDHRPFYSTGQRHGAYTEFDHTELPILDRYHVDLVISGHEHNYERSLPLRGGVVTSHDPRRYAQGQGTVFVLTGGGGANTYDDFGPAAPWDAVRVVHHEHLRIDVSAHTLFVVSISDTGKELDEFSVNRS